MEKVSLVHGDVTFYEANKIPTTAKKIEFKKGFVIEKGEGVHTHILENECEIYIDSKSNRTYLKQISKPIKVNHEEHGLQEIKTNTGIVYKDLERVFDYEQMEAKNVID